MSFKSLLQGGTRYLDSRVPNGGFHLYDLERVLVVALWDSVVGSFSYKEALRTEVLLEERRLLSH